MRGLHSCHAKMWVEPGSVRAYVSPMPGRSGLGATERNRTMAKTNTKTIEVPEGYTLLHFLIPNHQIVGAFDKKTNKPLPFINVGQATGQLGRAPAHLGWNGKVTIPSVKAPKREKEKATKPAINSADAAAIFGDQPDEDAE